jgi:hypothetical protein
VQLLEPVGSDLFLTVEAVGTVLQVRTPPDTPVQQDDNVTLTFHPAQAHVFDADGRSVRYAAEEAPASAPAIDEEVEKVGTELT